MGDEYIDDFQCTCPYEQGRDGVGNSFRRMVEAEPFCPMHWGRMPKDRETHVLDPRTGMWIEATEFERKHAEWLSAGSEDPNPIQTTQDALKALQMAVQPVSEPNYREDGSGKKVFPRRK